MDVDGGMLVDEGVGVGQGHLDVSGGCHGPGLPWWKVAARPLYLPPLSAGPVGMPGRARGIACLVSDSNRGEKTQ